MTCVRRRRRLWAPAPCPRRERVEDIGRRIAARGGLAPEDLDRALAEMTFRDHGHAVPEVKCTGTHDGRNQRVRLDFGA
jgi:hypothetical protein